MAPYRWRHAELGEVAAFLRGEAAKGVYRPILGGLHEL